MRVPVPVVPAAMLARLLGEVEAWFIFSTSPVAKVAVVELVAVPLIAATTEVLPKVKKTRSPAVRPTDESFMFWIVEPFAVQLGFDCKGLVKVTVVEAVTVAV